MRRSGRHAPIDLPADVPAGDQRAFFRHMSKEERYRAAKNGWRNWFINRGRLPLSGDPKAERQISWRRVF